jgi:hypothetical protein
VVDRGNYWAAELKSYQYPPPVSFMRLTRIIQDGSSRNCVVAL